jgi:hypothetical protein
VELESLNACRLDRRLTQAHRLGLEMKELAFDQVLIDFQEARVGGSDWD